MKQILFFILSIPLLINAVCAQKVSNPDYIRYIETYKTLAIREMLQYKIPASITLAQGIIESNCGKSVLATESLNHFGIKCHKEWMGEKYYYDDDQAAECFRKYNSIDESYRDHSLFLTTRNRYATLFQLSLRDYKGWANGLKQCGYATNPEYANNLIRVIEENALYLFDDTTKNNKTEVVTPNITEKEYVKNKENSVGNAAVDKQKKVLHDYIGRILFFDSYKQPAPENYKIRYVSKLGRNVYENYGVPFIFADETDTWRGIAKEFSLFTYQVPRQNDMVSNDKIRQGQIIYLSPKQKRRIELVYTVKEGDTMFSIAQEQCLKLKFLYKYNNMNPGEEPKPGSLIYLRK